MKKNSFFYSIITLTVLFISGCDPSSTTTPEQIRTTAIDCDTPAGILAMMAPPAIQSHGFDSAADGVFVRTKLFNTACPSCGNAENRCWGKIRMHMFRSTDRSRLLPLPEFASNANWNALNAVASTSALIETTTTNNEKSRGLDTGFRASVPVYYYRFAKEIEHPNQNEISPYVWSDIFVINNPSYNPPNPSTSGCTQADLEPAPEDDNEIIVFSDLSGSLSDSADNTFVRTAGVWCSGFFDSSGQLVFGDVSNDSNLGEVRQLTFPLPPITWGVRETNNVNVNTPFTVGLFRSGESNAIDTFNVSSINAGDTVNAPRQFTNRGTRTVFLFRSQGLDKCWVKTFIPGHGALDVRERNFVVKVDTGSAVAECSESNNQKTYNNTGGTTVIAP